MMLTVFAAFLLAFAVVIAASALLPAGPALTASYALGLVIVLLILVSILSISVKRLHDMNRSGWWIIAWWLFFAAALRLLHTQIGGVGDAVANAINIGSLIILGGLPGTRGANHFGPDPSTFITPN